ncbi:bola-like protein [Stereum hirsutum FP-91666 SS1]|uniref:Bola-like protein n=1 Tax=Stereum hirsutum (strain FP-91666) TaxID=721885 RepID=R7RVP2_STEHR|nr:bola-like protein [Stereum hirsutum FP-91666 SS1]EIM79174.1 bola-like protein [Stereum hirsutum FP-91666 SS1]
MATANSDQPVEDAIRSKLMSLLRPSELVITNDSYQHRHHAPMRAQGGGSGETHFSVKVVSDAFAGKSSMQRHRMIYAALAEEFEQGLHALSLNTKTLREVENIQNPS